MLRSCALLLLAATACSSGPTLALSQLDPEIQRARCERLARCQLFPDEASCNAYFRAIPDASIAAAVAAHKLDYDAELGRQCVDALARQSCDLTARDVRTPPAACRAMYTGRVAGGEMCSIDAECASATCELPDNCPEAGCCVGACRPAQSPAKAGGGCAKDHDCADGLVCGVDLTCRAPGAADGACAADHECAESLACIGASGGTPGMCRKLPHAGEACGFQRCAEENLRCDDGSHTCVARGLPGDPCPTATECAINIECDTATHLCREYPTLGMPCNGKCIGDAFCRTDDTGAGTCIALLANNAACDGNQECVSTFCEDGPVFRSCIDPYVCF